MENKLRNVFKSPYEQYKNRVGQEFDILFSFETESGMLYKIRFKIDGKTIDAWPEEIFTTER